MISEAMIVSVMLAMPNLAVTGIGSTPSDVTAAPGPHPTVSDQDARSDPWQPRTHLAVKHGLQGSRGGGRRR